MPSAFAFLAGFGATDFAGDWMGERHMGEPSMIAPSARVNPYIWLGSEIEAQTRYTLEVLAQLAEAAGSSLSRCVKADVTLTHPADFAGMDRVWREFFPDDPPESIARKALRVNLSDLAAKVREVDDVLIMLADEDRAYHLSQVLAEIAGISIEQALRVLMQRDSSGIAVACRSLGIGSTAFRAILQLRARRLYFSSRDVDDDVDAYDKLDLATAERTLRFLKLRTKIT